MRAWISALKAMLLAVFVLTAAPSAFAAESDADVRQVWKLLDYLAVDYSGAVADGAVTSPSEFAEMREFAATARDRLAALPPQPGHDALVKQAEQLQSAIDARTDPVKVADLAHALADSLLAAYPVPVAPSAAPDLARGAALYREHCASCHGAEGGADGPAAANLDPPVIAFTDHARARERSLFALYEVISQGLADTAMLSFQDALSDADRWAIAFHITNYAYTPGQRQQGEKLWQEDAALRAKVPNIEALTRATEAGLAADIGPEKAQTVVAYLRSQPGVVGADSSAGVALARANLAESVKAYQAGDAKRAASLALSAYLDGFEPVEPMLRARDSALLGRIETAMGEYRSRIAAGAPADAVAAQAKALTDLFDASEAALMASEGDASAAFLGAFTILVREGIEALLVVVAMIGFLTKVERKDVLPYVHAGWASALVAGVITWGIAVYVVDISGANRELTEGFAALFAAVVLLGVGIWMHQKSLAGRWQVYLKERMSAALTRKTAFFLFGLSFVAVYREVFETILFYVALWTRGNGGSILAGLAAGTLVLAVITVVLLRTSRRLPISQFFAASSILIAILAVVLTGKGVAALQEAGLLPVIAVNAPRIDILGIYPSAVSLAMQVAVTVFAVGGFLLNMRTPQPSKQK